MFQSYRQQDEINYLRIQHHNYSMSITEPQWEKCRHFNVNLIVFVRIEYFSLKISSFITLISNTVFFPLFYVMCPLDYMPHWEESHHSSSYFTFTI